MKWTSICQSWIANHYREFYLKNFDIYEKNSMYLNKN